MRVAPGKIDQIGSESHHNDPKTTLSRANKFRGPYSVGSFARGSIVRAPTNARSRAYSLNWRTIVWRHNLLPLGISANRARMLFPLLTADSGWTRRANNRSKSLVFQGIIDNHP